MLSNKQSLLMFLWVVLLVATFCLGYNIGLNVNGQQNGKIKDTQVKRFIKPAKYSNYIYKDVYGCFHATRECPKLSKSSTKENGVFVIRVNDYATDKLPYRNKICPVCFPDEAESLLDSCEETVVLTSGYYD